jgi:hypothetical protein
MPPKLKRWRAFVPNNVLNSLSSEGYYGRRIGAGDGSGWGGMATVNPEP